MGKVKVKKQSTFVDMTAMSDVTVLLLTFFMLTATFMPKEPVIVNTPASVSEKKVPEANTLNLLVDLDGRVFMSLDKPADKQATLEAMGERYGTKFDPKQIRAFQEQTHIGVPMKDLKTWLNLAEISDRDSYLKDKKKTMGIPTDSVDNQLGEWIQAALRVNEDLDISLKADQTTPYPYVENVMKTLSKIKQSRYTFMTNLRGMPEGL